MGDKWGELHLGEGLIKTSGYGKGERAGGDS